MLLAVAMIAPAVIAAGAAPASADPLPARATLAPGDRLVPGQALLSHDDRHRLVLQQDGNLVLYGRPPTPGDAPAILFSTDTFGQNMRELRMQDDGNLVLYRMDGTAAWDTRTAGRPVDMAIVQNDGNFVLYDGAEARFAIGVFSAPLMPTGGDRLDVGHALASGTYLRSPAGLATLVVEPTFAPGLALDYIWMYSASVAQPTLTAGGERGGSLELTPSSLDWSNGAGSFYEIQPGDPPLEALIVGDDTVVRLVDSAQRVVWFTDGRCGAGYACRPPS
jgi:hypothetical protein